VLFGQYLSGARGPFLSHHSVVLVAGPNVSGIKVTTAGKSSDVAVDPEWGSVVLSDSVREVTVDPSGCVLDIDHLSDTKRPFIGMEITDTSAAPAIAPRAISTTPTAVRLSALTRCQYLCCTCGLSEIVVVIPPMKILKKQVQRRI
jgi:hypothetical protein